MDREHSGFDLKLKPILIKKLGKLRISSKILMKYFRGSLYTSANASPIECGKVHRKQNNKPNWIVIQVIGCIFTWWWYQHPRREQVSWGMGKAEKVNAHSRPRGMRSRTRVGNDYPITLDAHRVKSVRAHAREKESVMDGTRDAREKRVFLASSLVFEANLIRLNCILGRIITDASCSRANWKLSLGKMWKSFGLSKIQWFNSGWF